MHDSLEGEEYIAILLLEASSCAGNIHPTTLLVGKNEDDLFVVVRCVLDRLNGRLQDIIRLIVRRYNHCLVELRWPREARWVGRHKAEILTMLLGVKFALMTPRQWLLLNGSIACYWVFELLQTLPPINHLRLLQLVVACQCAVSNANRADNHTHHQDEKVDRRPQWIDQRQNNEQN